ncbi:hypothetical protein FJZ18_04515 [Candidatus Pacearchaeota archaeon]|nr:hypothetical protein [Candidatus Pacearchaeota archaeon]
MLELRFETADILFTRDLAPNIYGEFINNLPLISQFCRQKEVGLSRIDTTDEKGYEELMLFFNDDCGGYTLQGIRNYLQED